MKPIHAIIVPIAIVAACNEAAHQLGIDPLGLLNTLSVPLVPVDGPHDAEPTHMACCGRMSDEARQYLEQNQASFPGAMWWRWLPDSTPTLEASHDGENLGQFWSWERCLEVAGLKRQEQDLSNV